MQASNDILRRSCDALKHYNTILAMSKKSREAVRHTQEKLSELNVQLDDLEQAGAFLRVVSDWSRRKSIGRIEDTVNSALSQIFSPREMKLKIEFDTKASRVNANLYMSGESGELEDIMNGRGGGVRDIVSVLLRIMFKKMVHPPLSGPIVLDESLRFLNSIDEQSDYVVRTYRFLKEIALSFDDQMIIVTSADSVAKHGRVMDSVDKMFRVRLVNGVSKVDTTYDADKERGYGE
jgi:hypothetical protein